MQTTKYIVLLITDLLIYSVWAIMASQTVQVKENCIYSRGTRRLWF